MWQQQSVIKGDPLYIRRCGERIFYFKIVITKMLLDRKKFLRRELEYFKSANFCLF